MICVFILMLFLAFLSWQDYKEQQIYSIIPIIGCILGIICNYFADNLYNAVIGACFGFVLLYVFYFFMLKIKKKEGIGFGDVLVSAMIGAFIELDGIYFSLALGFLFALIFCFFKKQKKVPLIPFFCFGVIITQFLGVFYEIKVFDFTL